MARAVFALGFFSSQVLAHPGHGALEIHWHLDDLVLVALAVAVVVGIVYFLKKKPKQ